MSYMTKEYPSLLNEFIAGKATPEDPVLAELNRITYQKVLNPRMISGHQQGQLLTFLSHMIRPELIIEIGTFTGYSAICLAKGLKDGGTLHTIDKNDELRELALKYFEKAGLKNRIILHNGDALQILRGIDLLFDLAYIDGEKSEYPDYLKLLIPMLKPGGFLIADNIFWNGKVLNPDCREDPSTMGILNYCEMLKGNKQFENTILPIRDGLMISRKLR